MLFTPVRQEAESASQWRNTSVCNVLCTWGLRLGDLGAMLAGGLLAHALRFGTTQPLPPAHVHTLTSGLLLAFIVFNGSSLYRSWRGRGLTGELAKLLSQWTLLFAALAVLHLASKTAGEVSRLWWFGWFGTSLTLAVVLRLFVRGAANWVRERGLDLRSAVVVASSPAAAERIVQTLHAHRSAGIRVCGWYHTSVDSGLALAVPQLGSLDGIADYVQRHCIDQVWISVPLSAQHKIDRVMQALSQSTAAIRLAPDLRGMELLNHSVEQIAGLQVLNLRSDALEGSARVTKGILDRVLAAAIVVAIAPLLLALVIGVKLSSPGPVLFRQKRMGRGGREFEMWKFRSMRVHEEHGDQVTQATRNDPRVTRFGAFLRRTSLDELPQFFNVLQGSMSVVGPRPHAIAHNRQYKDQVQQYMQRYRIKPGITGWAQVNGLRGETDTVAKMARRVEHDLYYLQNWSLWFDLRIIVLTVFRGFFGNNAY